MKSLFARNISNTGRLVRGVGAVGLLVGAGFSYFLSVWLGVTLAVVRNRPAASVQPPQFSLRAQRDDVVVRFRKAGHQGVIIESRRGAETEFARLAVRTFSPFRDQRPVLVPGTPEVRVYRLRFMDHDEPSAACSDLQEILLRGEIIVRERTEAAEAAKGA